MARAAGTVTIPIVGDVSKLKEALGEADRDLGGFSGKVGKVADKLSSAGKKMTVGLTLPIVGAGAAMFKMAGDSEESLSKMNAVFGKSAAEIEKWSKGTAKSIGLSAREAVDAAGSFGNMFTQLGIGTPKAAALSTEMVNLAADFASFHNADITEVINAQSAAFRGEYDALQRFLPLINAAAVEEKALALAGGAVNITAAVGTEEWKKQKAALIAAKESITDQDKALAVHALMLEGAGTALGDFGRTSDSAANQQRIMTAELKDAATALGADLLPIGKKVIDWLRDMVAKFTELSPKTQELILQIAAITAVLGPLATAIGTVSTALIFLAANPIVLLIAAVGAVALAIVAAKNEWVTFPDPIIIALNAVMTVWRWSVLEPILLQFDMLISGATAAFGWIPGIGPKLQEANTQFDRFAAAARSALEPIPLAAERARAALVVIRDEAARVEAAIRRMASAGVTVGVTMVPVGGVAPAQYRFHSGGVVPGVPGTEVMARLQAGETVLPIGASAGGSTATTVNHYEIAVTAIDPAAAQEAVVAAIREYERRNGTGWRAG